MPKKIFIIFFLFFIPFTSYSQLIENKNSSEFNEFEDSELIEKNIEEEIDNYEWINNPLENKTPNKTTFLSVIITSIEIKNIKNEYGIYSKDLIQVQGKTRKNKDKNYEFYLDYISNPQQLDLVVGDEVILKINEYDDNRIIYVISDYLRINGIILMILLFLITILAIGGKQGQKTILSLIISFILIFYVLIPKILEGYNPIVLSFIISFFIIIITIFLISGLSKKTLIAILGTLGGLIIAIWISYLFTKMTYLFGLSSDVAKNLFINNPHLNPQGIFFAGIIIGTLGAVMDVAMSIASSLNEIKIKNTNIGSNELFKSGIQIGKDIMGTMSNTLIFAYVGVSLPLLLSFKDLGGNYNSFMNLNYVAEEIIRSIGGSIGLMTVIPITAIIGATLYTKQKK